MIKTRAGVLFLCGDRSSLRVSFVSQGRSIGFRHQHTTEQHNRRNSISRPWRNHERSALSILQLPFKHQTQVNWFRGWSWTWCLTDAGRGTADGTLPSLLMIQPSAESEATTFLFAYQFASLCAASSSMNIGVGGMRLLYFESIRDTRRCS